MSTVMEDSLSNEESKREQIDARPALPVSEKSLWKLAEKMRDQLASQIDDEFKKENINAWIRKSKPGEYPIHLLVESWKKVSESDIAATFDRSSLKITITVEPYLEEHLSYKVELQRHQKSFSEEYWMLTRGEVAELVGYLIHGGSKPSFFKPRVPAISLFLSAFLPFFGPPKNKLIPEARPNFWAVESILGWGGAIALGIFIIATIDEANSYYPTDTSTYIFFALLSGMAIAFAAIIHTRRPNLDALPKQSLRAPRREFLVDSWHVSVPGAGEDFDRFKDRICKAVIDNDPSLESEIEIHQNLTPRGFEERERLVLTKGQSTLHLHVYPYSDNAFVGWESYLNWNRWGEGPKVSATVTPDGNRVTYRTLEVGVHVPSDFDLIDVNVLSETVHRVLVNEVRGFLKEKEIEADLDFKIIRGDRSRALSEGKSKDKGD